MTAVLVLACCPVLAPRAAAQAEDLYKAHCSSCHGADGSGSTTAGKKMGLGDLRSPQVQGLSDDALFKTIAYGVKHKQYPHAFVKRGLTEEQIMQLVSYLRKLPKSK
ncbi:MAG: cytochrome c [Acidobacteriia bacterium]|nr:cytochrome c [Terriglobia bacterium]